MNTKIKFTIDEAIISNASIYENIYVPNTFKNYILHRRMYLLRVFR